MIALKREGFVVWGGQGITAQQERAVLYSTPLPLCSPYPFIPVLSP